MGQKFKDVENPRFKVKTRLEMYNGNDKERKVIATAYLYSLVCDIRTLLY